MNKLYDKIIWHNDTTPALNETNLNKMSKAIDDIDDRVVLLADDVFEQIPQIQAYLEQADDLVEALELMTANPPYIGANGHWYTWDTSQGAYVDSGIDASITVQIADITMLAPDATPYVTNSGTDTDPIFHLFIPRGAKGDNGVSPQITITTIAGGHRVTITDAEYPQGQSFDVMDGAGSGDMQAATYDPNGDVASAGGIADYVEEAIADNVVANPTGTATGTLTKLGIGSDIYEIQGGGGSTVGITNSGTASASTTRQQQLTIDGASTDISGSKYMEQTISAQANTDTTFTFTNAAITYASVLDIFAGCKTADYAIPTLKSKTLSVSGGTGTLTLVYNVPTAYALTVRVYIK